MFYATYLLHSDMTVFGQWRVHSVLPATTRASRPSMLAQNATRQLADVTRCATRQCNEPLGQSFAVQCCQCPRWYHGVCVQLTAETAEATNQQGLEWICRRCYLALLVDTTAGSGRSTSPFKPKTFPTKTSYSGKVSASSLIHSTFSRTRFAFTDLLFWVSRPACTSDRPGLCVLPPASRLCHYIF